MRPQVILVATLVVALGVLAALPLGKGQGSWPCCDNCGTCNRKNPPECQCNDISVRGCHPECIKCVNSSNTIPPRFGPGPVVFYRCADILTNFCERRCTPTPPAPAPAPFVGGVF